MASKMQVTKTRRRLRRKNMGTVAKKKRVIKGTTPKLLPLLGNK